MSWGSGCRYPLAHGRLGPTETAPPHTSTTIIDEEHDTTDEELLAALVRDWAIACEYQFSPSLPPCGAPAKYWVICRYCDAAYAECAPHRATEAAKWALDPYAFVRCRRCDAIAQHLDWRSLVLIVPIGAHP